MTSPRLEALRANPHLWKEIGEYWFSPAALKRRLAEEKHRASLAAAKAAAIEEEIRAIKLRQETSLLESRARRYRQQYPIRHSEKVMGSSSAKLLSDQEVEKMYDKWRR